MLVIVDPNTRQRFLFVAALCFLLAGIVVIGTNLIAGVSVARSIGRGVIPFAVGAFVLLAVRRGRER